eukprot:COSAG06_NODE_9795_length_1814_cov_3.251895_1_plen_127_part_00
MQGRKECAFHVPGPTVLTFAPRLISKFTISASSGLIKIAIISGVCKKTVSLLSFPCVCPEPVLVKRLFLYMNGYKIPFSHQATFRVSAEVWIGSAIEQEPVQNVTLFWVSLPPMFVPSLYWQNDRF